MISNLKLQSNTGELNKLNLHIRALQKKWGLPKKMGIEVNLVLDELISNIIEHGQSGETDSIEIRLQKSGQELTIEVINAGPPFDPTRCKKADITLPLEKRQCGGLGIHLVKKLSDSCCYTRLDDKNIFRCKKTIPNQSR